MEHTSTTISSRVERVTKLRPHEVQRTVVSVSSGWTCVRGIASFSVRGALPNRCWYAAAYIKTCRTRRVFPPARIDFVPRSKSFAH